MADRTSAELFGYFFTVLAELKRQNKLENWKEIANQVWNRTSNYDFSPYQMDCDQELVELGLAKLVPDPDDPPEKSWVYKGDRHWRDDG